MENTPRRRLLFAALAAPLLILLVALTFAPARQVSLRHFDADRIASLELRMWQAYYAKERVRLFALLVVTLREQYGYAWVTAARAGFHLARAAATFGDAQSHYDVVLPDLTEAYRLLKAQAGAPFDPADVARRELAWWVARREPGQNAPEQIGRLIAEEYAALYSAPLDEMLHPARLRAQAAALRDSQAQQPDWPAIEQLLVDSHRALSRTDDDRSVENSRPR